MRSNIILPNIPKKHRLLPVNGGKLIAAYNQAHQLACKLSKAWGDIEIILNDEQSISTEKDAVLTLSLLNTLYHAISQSTSHYVLHPSLLLSQHLQREFCLQERPSLLEADKTVLLEKLKAYMANLFSQLNESSHRKKCANFDRLSRRKRINVQRWLNHQVLSQNQRVLNVKLYSSFCITNDINREQLTAAVAHLNHTLSNQQSMLRQCNGYIWQLLYDDGIGYYVDWLLAIPSDEDKKVLLKLFYHAWKESWRKVTNLPRDIPLPFVVQDRGSVLSSEHIDDSINNITAHYCSLDGIMKLNLPKAVKTYSMSRTPKLSPFGEPTY